MLDQLNRRVAMLLAHGLTKDPAQTPDIGAHRGWPLSSVSNSLVSLSIGGPLGQP